MSSLKRPTSILVFSIIMIAAPVLAILENALFNMLPLWGEGNVFSKMAVSDILILLLYPAAAVSIYTVTKAGWWIFIFSAAGIFAYNIFAYISNPMISLFSLLFFNTLLFIIAGLFFRKHIIAPYFNPRLRWWEQASRYDIDLGVYLDCSDSYEIGYLEDISLGGCFIRLSEKINTGEVYSFRFCLGSRIKICLKGRIMRTVVDDCSLTGYGIMFSNLNEMEKEGLSNMIEDLYRFGLGEPVKQERSSEQRHYDRYTVNVNVSFRYESEILPARLINFSSTGACIETMLDMEVDEFCGFYCTLGYSSLDVDGLIKWKKKFTHHKHYGITFINESKKHKADIARMIGTIKALGGSTRSGDRKEYNKLVEKTLPGTPYRVFQKANR